MTAPDIHFRSLNIGDDPTDFRLLNEEWIRKFFTLEPKDQETLGNPDDAILRKGGKVFLAYLDNLAVGCVALIPVHAHTYELAKMAIAPHLRGQGLGRKLLVHVIDQARQMGARHLELASSTKLPNAIHLYQSLGFRHIPQDQWPPSEYARSDVFMHISLDPAQ